MIDPLMTTRGIGLNIVEIMPPLVSLKINIPATTAAMITKYIKPKLPKSDDVD